MRPLFFIPVKDTVVPIEVEGHHRSPNKGQGQLRSNFLRSCRFLILFLKLGSLRFGEKARGSAKEPIRYKIYRILLAAAAVYEVVPHYSVARIMMAFQQYQQPVTFSPVFYSCDNLLIIILLVTDGIYHAQITSVVDRLLDKMQELDLEPGLLLRCKIFAHGLLAMGVVLWLIMTAAACTEVYSWNPFVVDFYLQHAYKVPRIPIQFKRPILVLLLLLKSYLITCIYLHFCVVMLIAFILRCCFGQINDRLGAARDVHGLDDLRAIQTDHQDLANLTRQASNAFSPALFIFIGLKCIQLLLGINVIEWNLLSGGGYFKYNAFKACIAYGNAVAIILIATVVGGQLQNVAQSTLNALVDISLQKREMYKDGGLMKVIENIHTTTLFTAQRIANPIGINVSGIFILNYNLLAVVRGLVSTSKHFGTSASKYAPALLYIRRATRIHHTASSPWRRQLGLRQLT